jgi:tetratricopeptide (TPR) repeat protein
LDEGVLSTFFLSISEASRKDKSKDYLKLLIDFARQNPKSPHTPYAYLYLGSEKNFQRSFAEAIEYFDKALASEKSIGGIFNFLYENRSLEFTAYYQRGVVKMLMKDFESAESDFMISQKKIPESDMSFFSKVRIKGRLCEALLLQNKDAKALALMDELLKISEDKQALMKTADLFLKQKALSKEAALLEKNNQGPDIKEMYVQKLSQLAKNVYDRLKLTADLPFENRKVARIVNHYRNLKSELSGEFGETLKP